MDGDHTHVAAPLARAADRLIAFLLGGGPSGQWEAFCLTFDLAVQGS